MRPPDISEQDIIEAGITIAASGRPVTGSGIRTILGRGNVARCKRVWDAEVKAQEQVASRRAALPEQISQEMEAIMTGLVSDIARLVHRLNDLALKDARQHVVLGLATAREQQDALQQDLEETAKSLEDAEAQRDAARSQCEGREKLLMKVQMRAQVLETQNVRLKERLNAAKAAGARVNTYRGNAAAARAEVASIAGRLEEAQAVNEQLIASRV